VICTIAPTTGPMENAQVAVLDLKTGKKKTLIRGGSQAEYVESGHLIYAIAGTLRAVRFDPVALEVLGEPMPVIERVLTKANGTTADFSVSRHGTLVYVTGTTAARAIPRTLVWVDRKGHEEPIPAPPRAYVSARVSPDGTRLALDARDEQNDIWIWDLARQTLQRLTNDPGFSRSPVWTPDGRRVAFTAERDGVESVYWQAFDGSGASERLSSGTRIELPLAFSPDGAQLMSKQPLAVPGDLGVIVLGATRSSTILLHSAADEENAVISPDGHWLAYNSDESGRDEVYLRPFPAVETGRQQVSTGGGTRPLWSRNGRELFYYVAPDTIMAVPVRLGPDVVLGRPQTVVKGPYAIATVPGRHYDVSADGQRFLLLKDAPGPGGRQAAEPEIQVVLNWSEELKSKVAAK